MLLHAEDLKIFYGPVEAIHGISFDVNEGEIVSIVGNNGAGKTTILKTISGLKDFSKGDIQWQTSLDKGTQRKTTENELPSLTQCTA